MQVQDHNYFMQKALEQARLALEQQEVPIGAVLVIDGKIISRTYNQVEKLKDSTAHAEILALTGAFSSLGSKYLPDALLYVTLEPCLMCAGAIFWSKIGTLVYGADDKKNGYKSHLKAEHTPFHPKTTVVSGICSDESAALITDFFKSRR